MAELGLEERAVDALRIGEAQVGVHPAADRLVPTAPQRLDGVGVAVEGKQRARRSRLPDHQGVPQPRDRTVPGQATLDGCGDRIFGAGLGRDLDECRQRVGQRDHTGTSNTRSASLSEVFSSGDSVRLPMMSAH